jgi:hypothetical protein
MGCNLAPNGDIGLITSQADALGKEIDYSKIRKHLRKSGFEEVTGSVFYRGSDNILLLDIHEGNAREREGDLVLYDANVLHPTARERRELGIGGGNPYRSRAPSTLDLLRQRKEEAMEGEENEDE